MARRLRIGCALVVASAFGCNSIAGIHDPVDKDPASSSGTLPPDDGGAVVSVDRFIGRWTTTAGAQKLTNCSAAQSVTGQTLTLIVSRGAASGTIVVSPEPAPDCRISSSVLGNQATLLPGQTCSFSFPNGEIDTYTYTAPTTFTITATDATVANVHITATILFTPPGERCGFEETSVYTKQP